MWSSGIKSEGSEKAEMIQRLSGEENVKSLKQKRSALRPAFSSLRSMCQSAAERRPRLTMMTDTFTSRRSQRRTSPPHPGENPASFCPLNGPAPPVSHPSSPPSLHLIRGAPSEPSSSEAFVFRLICPHRSRNFQRGFFSPEIFYLTFNFKQMLIRN